MKQVMKPYIKMFYNFLRKHKTNKDICTTLCSKKAGINLSQQINNNYSKNISNSKIIQLPNFHMVGKISSNYMKKAALTIRVNAAFLFLFCCRLQQTRPNSIHRLQTYNVFDGSELRK